MTDGLDTMVGTLRRAREVYRAELDRLKVAVEVPSSLGADLEKQATRFGVSRSYFLRRYVTEASVVAMAATAACEVAGLRYDVLQSRLVADVEYPESKDWPAEVRAMLWDHLSVGSQASDAARQLDGSAVELGPFRFVYESEPVAAWRASEEHDGTVSVVTVQHRDVVKQAGPLRADPAWGYKAFDWAYPLAHNAYAERTGIACDRLLWAWADAPVVAAAHRPDLLTERQPTWHPSLQARQDLVLVVARVPAARCLLTSHTAWEHSVLTHRYLPVDYDDALEFHGSYGSLLTSGDRSQEVANDAIRESWQSRVFDTTGLMEAQAQVCIDEIRREEIVEIVDPDLIFLALQPTDALNRFAVPARLD